MLGFGNHQIEMMLKSGNWIACQRREKKVEENETILGMEVNKRNQRV